MVMSSAFVKGLQDTMQHYAYFKSKLITFGKKSVEPE